MGFWFLWSSPSLSHTPHITDACPSVNFYGKRDFADEMDVLYLNTGRISWIIQVGQCNHMGLEKC